MKKKHTKALITLYTLLLFFIGFFLQAAPPDIVFHAHPHKIALGDTVVLSWDATPVPGCRGVYISNVGKVSPKGKITVAPRKKNTIYYLLCDTAGEPTVTPVTITVKGGRDDGGDLYPQAKQFTDGPHYRLQAPSLHILLDRLQALMQDTMGFQVDVSYKRNQKHWVFVTKPLIRPHLKKPDDGGIRHRRLAYRVEIIPAPSPTGTFSCRIRTFIQYRRFKERAWRTETDHKTAPALHRQCAQDLHNRYKTIK